MLKILLLKKNGLGVMKVDKISVVILPPEKV
jgi:hypothetical protein